MADPRMTLLDLLAKTEQGVDPSFLRDGLKLLAQELMEAEVTQLIGAAPYERTEGRLNSRNGYRDREWDTRVGTLELQIPKLRQSTYFPSLLEPRAGRGFARILTRPVCYGVGFAAPDRGRRRHGG
jgi:transposase-like protein